MFSVFVLGAVSPAVVVPSMLILQAGGYGVEKGVPTLLMAAGSIDDIWLSQASTLALGWLSPLVCWLICT